MKKKLARSKKQYPTPSAELKRALDAFPKAVKLKEKAAKEKKKIMKNFLSVKDQVYKS